MISLEARKIALAQALFDLSDETVLKAIEALVFQGDQEQDNNWRPTKEEIEGIKEAITQVENGEAISEKEVKERYKKWLK